MSRESGDTVDWKSKGEARTGGMNSQDSEQHCRGGGGECKVEEEEGVERKKRRNRELLVEEPVPYFRNCVLGKEAGGGCPSCLA